MQNQALKEEIQRIDLNLQDAQKVESQLSHMQSSGSDVSDGVSSSQSSKSSNLNDSNDSQQQLTRRSPEHKTEEVLKELFEGQILNKIV